MLLRLVNCARFAYAAARRTVGNIFFEWPAGVDTSSIVLLRDIGLESNERLDYHPTPWLALRRVLAEDDVAGHDVFLDFGCGKGRVLLQAAARPFRKVIGVELSPELAEIARRNIAGSLLSLKCQNIEVVVADAMNYRVPDDVTVVYFFNPFQGEIFAGALAQILASLRRRSREITVIYMAPFEHQMLIDAGARLVKRTRGMRPTRKWSKETAIHVYKLVLPAVNDAPVPQGNSE